MKKARCVALGLVLAAVTGCSSDVVVDPEAPAMFTAEIDSILQGQPSELEREVLADYEVSDSEMGQAREAFSACMDGFGLEASFGDGSGFAYGMTPDSQDSFAADYDDRDVALDKMVEIADECTIGTIGNIGFLYYEMARNPQGLSFAERVWQCLEADAGNPAADLTDDQLAQALTDEAFTTEPAVAACLDAQVPVAAP